MSTLPRTRDASLPRFLLLSARRGLRVEEGLARFVALGAEVEQVSEAARARAEPDLVLYDLEAGLAELAELRARFGGTPVMVFGPSAQARRAREALAAGAHEWLCVPERGAVDEERIFDAVERLLLLGPRPALPRARRPGTVPTAGALLAREVCEGRPLVPASAPFPSEASPAVPRAAVPEPTLPQAAETVQRGLRLVRLFEVESDGGPARRAAPRFEPVLVRGERFALTVEAVEPFSAQTVLAAFEGEGTRWASFEVEAAEGGAGERVTLSLRRGRGARDFFRPGALVPLFDPATMRYRRAELGDVARAWVELGVLRELELDRVLVCPKCQALPTFRMGCRRCGSAQLDAQRLIHHFPCAHVGFLASYQLDGLLVCPKCAARPLIVNSDFEYLDGPARCGDCGSHESDGEMVGHCFGCGLRFLARLAATLTLKGFDVDRLDPLALELPSD